MISPGERPRGQVLAEQGRAVVAVAVGLVGVLLVSGLIEALVTPAPLPTALRVGIGVVAEATFLAYVIYFGRRAVRAGSPGILPMLRTSFRRGEDFTWISAGLSAGFTWAASAGDSFPIEGPVFPIEGPVSSRRASRKGSNLEFMTHDGTAPER